MVLRVGPNGNLVVSANQRLAVAQPAPANQPAFSDNTFWDDGAPGSPQSTWSDLV